MDDRSISEWCPRSQGKVEDNLNPHCGEAEITWRPFEKSLLTEEYSESLFYRIYGFKIGLMSLYKNNLKDITTMIFYLLSCSYIWVYFRCIYQFTGKHASYQDLHTAQTVTACHCIVGSLPLLLLVQFWCTPGCSCYWQIWHCSKSSHCILSKYFWSIIITYIKKKSSLEPHQTKAKVCCWAKAGWALGGGNKVKLLICKWRRIMVI